MGQPPLVTDAAQGVARAVANLTPRERLALCAALALGCSAVAAVRAVQRRRAGLRHLAFQVVETRMAASY